MVKQRGARTLDWRVGRWRRRAGLALLAFGTIWSIAMAVSAKWWWGYCSPEWIVDIGDGTLYVNPYRGARGRYTEPLLGWFGGVNYDTNPNGTGRSWMWTWWAWGQRANSWEPVSAYTIWPLAPLSLASGGLLYWPSMRSSRRLRRNQCLQCGYSRDGLAAGAPCPECGD